MAKIATAVLEIKTDTGQVKTDLTALEQVGYKVGKTYSQIATEMSKGFSDFGSHVRRVESIINDFSGQKAIEEAHAVAKAVQSIGGASKLTADQQRQVSSVMSSALQAHKARGDEAAASIKNLAAETGKASTASQGWSGWLGKANGMLAALGTGIGLAGVIGFGKQILADTGHLEDLHEATGVSLTGLQQLGHVGSEINVDMDDLGKAVGNLSDRLAGGDKGAANAVGMLGLSVKQLQQAGPLETFLQVAEGAGRIEDPMVKASVASDLFGAKLGKKLIPLLGDLRQKMQDVPNGDLISDKDIQDADALGDAIGHLTTKFEAYTFRVLHWFKDHSLDPGPTIQQQVDALDYTKRLNLLGPERMPQGNDIALPPTAPKALSQAELLQNRLTQLRTQAMEPLSATQKQSIADLIKWGEAEGDIAKLVQASETAVHLYAEQLKKSAEATKKQAEEDKKLAEAIADVVSHATRWYELIQTVDGAVVEGAKYYIERGASLEKVAKMYGLTEGQIEAISASMKFEQTMVDATGESYAQLTKRLNDTLKARLDLNNAGFSKNLSTGIAAEQSAIDIRNKQSMSAYEFQVTLIKREADERRRSLDPKASGYSDALQAIADETDAKMGEASRSWQEHVQDMQASTVSWANATRSFLQSVPGLIQSAFTGGGGLKGGLKALGSNLGASLFGEKGPLGFGAGGLLNGVGNKLAGVFGTGLGLALPGIGTAIGSLIGPLAGKIGGLIKQAFGGPSKDELAGRDVVKQFEGQFANVGDMVAKITDAYTANGRSAGDAQAAIQRMWAAEKQGADATRQALEAINAELQHHQEVVDAIHAQGFQSQDEITHAADIANQAYQEMLASGKYTAAQVDQAYRHYQELLAQLEGAAGEAARAWLKAHKAADDAVDASSDAMKSAEDDLKGLIDKRNDMAKGIAAEAPEAVMGVIEQQQRGELAALDKEIADKADKYAQLAHDTGKEMADEIVKALKAIHLDPLHIGVVLDASGGGPAGVARGEHAPGSSPSGPAPSTGPSYEDFVRDYWAPDRDAVLASMPHMAAGAYMPRVTKPTAAVWGEAGPEDAVFGGAGRSLAKDVAAALMPVLQQSGGGTFTVRVPVYLNNRVLTEAVVTDVSRDKYGAGTKMKRGLGLASV